ncbi:MAG: hypothetical protein ABSE16_15810 [Verrucomicrobiota bacterium]|jgi:hypothetical protein
MVNIFNIFCDFHSLSFLASSLFAALARLFHKPWKSLTKVKQCSHLAFPPLHHQEHAKASVARGMGERIHAERCRRVAPVP